jgi:hypothetical protein
MHYPFYTIDEEQQKETCSQAASFTSPYERIYATRAVSVSRGQDGLSWRAGTNNYLSHNLLILPP